MVNETFMSVLEYSNLEYSKPLLNRAVPAGTYIELHKDMAVFLISLQYINRFELVLKHLTLVL